ncbi:MAG TPA: transposase [Tepidisphaeraceae bacterium]|nr:transposase [Tepidisphaeraceae bacterium]
MATIDSLLEQIKHNPASLLRHLPVQAVCQELKLKWRQRCLDPATTLGLFIGQIVHGNCSCAQVRHLAGGRVFSAQAYCKARKRLSLELIKRLSARVCESVRRQTDASALFAGHRVFLIDGSHVILPDTPVLQKEFGQPSCQKPGCGMPQAHLLALFDLSSGMLMDVVVSPLRTHDLAKASALHPSMRPGDLIVGDTGFSS